MRHVYFHIPFCHRICPYCSFHKHLPGDTDIAAFVGALLDELRQAAEQHEVVPRTIYFGGGTPTFLSRRHMEPLLTGIAGCLDLSQLEEWTVEANPAIFFLEKAKLMRHLGVTRISLGVQSWEPELLRVLGRDHLPGDARESVHTLREAGFDNLNIDLMFALPGQRLSQWEETLQTTIDLKPDHISCYNLTYEEDTEFMRRFETGEYSQSHDDDAPFFERAAEMLGGAGFRHYEISNYAQAGRESAHNRAYWQGHEYLGIGPSAVSTIGNTRSKNIADTRLYVQRVANGEPTATDIEELTSASRVNEAIALQLRTDEGLDLARAPHLTEMEIRHLIDEDLLVSTGGRLILTPKGKLVADAVAAELLV